jgi:hypothetical protein
MIEAGAGGLELLAVVQGVLVEVESPVSEPDQFYIAVRTTLVDPGLPVEPS